MTDREERERKAAQYRKLSLLSTVGLMFPSSIGVGIAIGYFLDRWIGTQPWLLMLFALLGIAAGFVNLFRVVSKFDSNDD
ncbi:MAG: AtpZ/AtpI family protein [Acidobacteria bacterium]|nr:AtpZ/AtpI family protein [Acidobacteriota bacterium]